MLPIPAPIIGSTGSASGCAFQHKRFFIPLIYLGGTASLCYLFLFALIISHDKSDKPQAHRRTSGILEFLSTRGSHSEKGNQVGKGKGQVKFNNKGVSLAENSTVVSGLQAPFHRKTLHSLKKKTREKRKQNGTWRSNPTKVWVGHQDLEGRIEKGIWGTSALPGVYSFPKSKDGQCKSFRVLFAKKDTFKPRALVSFPGSGNSWLRYLIERATGYFTGSVYNDQKLFKSGLLGELRQPNDGTTILQKTHHDTVGKRKAYLKLSELMFSYRGVLLIRNPYDALVAYWNFLNNQSEDKHRGVVSKSEFHDIKWANFVTRKIPLWTSLIMSWVENSQDYLIVLYEDVQKNPGRELVRILEYLNQPVDKLRLDCLLKGDMEGPFHRSHLATSSKTSKSIVPLGNSFPFTITSTLTTLSLQNITEKGELPSYNHHQSHQDEQRLFILDSKKSQMPTLTGFVGAHPEHIRREEKDKFLLLPTSSSSPKSLSQTTSSTPSHHHQQNPEFSSRMTSGTIPLSQDKAHQRNNNNRNDNNHLNSSILRLDLIIQDNIDKINRFFQQKSIPLQLLYTPRPSITSYYFLQPKNLTISTTPVSSSKEFL